MIIKVENVGCIQETSIKIGEHITVLSGGCHVGKSLVLKIMYMILNSLSSRGEAIGSKIEESIRSKLKTLDIKEGQITLIPPILGSPEIRISLSGDRITDRWVRNDFSPFNSITYIETPLILQDFNFIRNSLFSRSQTYPSGKTIDLPPWKLNLINKLQINAESEFYLSDSLLAVYDLIKQTIKGEIIYDYNQDSYMFYKEDMPPVRMLHTPSGVKSFGLLQALIKANAIDGNTALLIDDVELHLSPEWQLAYANVLVKLAKIGVQIIVSTHSSCMVEALSTYSSEKQTKFYHVEETNEGSVFNDLSDKLVLQDTLQNKQKHINRIIKLGEFASLIKKFLGGNILDGEFDKQVQKIASELVPDSDLYKYSDEQLARCFQNLSALTLDELFCEFQDRWNDGKGYIVLIRLICKKLIDRVPNN